MNIVRLGAVGYLNARPLVYGLDARPEFALRFDVPSRCADLLHEGAIDLGLIPSIEYLRGENLSVVPSLAIASRGPVASVAIYTTKDMADVRSIALDTSSRTSVALVSVLCARAFRIKPDLAPAAPNLSAMLKTADAALMIGDIALFQSASEARRTDEGPQPAVQKIDLGELWTRMTGLPFVYAFWAGRKGVVSAEHVQALRAARDAGVRKPQEIASAYYPDSADRQAMAVRYLQDNIKYHLGDEERAGVELFHRYAADAGVVRAARPLSFY
ncbi:MAG TPA: menaquinone biosynthesis protein [Vicinamibacterales bacterium]|jgi:predicted solute-binding protein|nr:menaquinone biosynthesis protein [Vicinamibacterales bacterium]